MPVNVWHEHFVLSDLWQRFEQDPTSFEQVRDEIVQRFRSAWFYDPEVDKPLAILVADLADSPTPDSFNRAWNQLYYWADDNRVWLCTDISCPDCAKRGT